jgi:hypothetical protein
MTVKTPTRGVKASFAKVASCRKIQTVGPSFARLYLAYRNRPIWHLPELLFAELDSRKSGSQNDQTATVLRREKAVDTVGEFHLRNR